MERVRWLGRVGLGLSLLAVGVASLLIVGAALVAGDWWLAPEPWIGLGLDLLIIGLGATAVFALLRDVVEPVGWLRLLAVPPVLFVGAMWWFLVAIGFPMTGRGPRAQPDVATLLYSVPGLIPLAIVATLTIALPLVIARFTQRRSAPRLI